MILQNYPRTLVSSQIFLFGILKSFRYSDCMSKGIFTEKQKKLLTLLRQVRQEAGLSQRELAERLNRSQSFVSKFETGEIRLDLLELHQLCEVVGISLQEFVRRFENSSDETR